MLCSVEVVRNNLAKELAISIKYLCEANAQSMNYCLMIEPARGYPNFFSGDRHVRPLSRRLENKIATVNNLRLLPRAEECTPEAKVYCLPENVTCSGYEYCRPFNRGSGVLAFFFSHDVTQMVRGLITGPMFYLPSNLQRGSFLSLSAARLRH